MFRKVSGRAEPLGEQAGKVRTMEGFGKTAQQRQTLLPCTVFDVAQHAVGEPAEDDGFANLATSARLGDQLESRQIRQALVAQQQVVRLGAAFHGGHRFHGGKRGCQQVIALIVEQYLGGDQLKRVIFHQEYPQVVSEHGASDSIGTGTARVMPMIAVPGRGRPADSWTVHRSSDWVRGLL